MDPVVNRTVVDAAVKAKRAQQQAAAARPPVPESSAMKAVAIGIWVAAVGSLVAVFLAN